MKIVKRNSYQQNLHTDINNISKNIYETFLRDFAYYNISKTNASLISYSTGSIVTQVPSINYTVYVNEFLGIKTDGTIVINPAQQTLSFTPPSLYPRIDIIQVDYKYTDYTTETRKFINAGTGIPYNQSTYTEQLIDADITIKKGVENSGLAPTVDTGKLKIAEVYVDTTGGIANADIHNVDSLFGVANTGWTVDTTSVILLKTLQTHRVTSTLDHPNNSVTADKLIATGTSKTTPAALDRFLLGNSADSYNGVYTPLNIIFQSGAGAPATTPSFIGQRYVDTTGKIAYYAKGTSSSSDWVSGELSGTGAPASTPNFVGQRYVDTTGLVSYVATGTTNSGDWKAQEMSSHRGAASGYASLDGSSLVVQNPANATATPTAGKIPIADGSGKLDGWISTATPLKNSVIYGLNFTNDGGTPNTKLDIAAGQATDDTFAYLLVLGTFVKTTGSFSAGTGNGALDTGSVAASKEYAVYLIRKDSDGTIDVLFSLSATSPTMPGGYTYKRLIGFFHTDGSNNIIAGRWRREGNRLFFKFADSTQAYCVSRAYAVVANTNRILVTVRAPVGSIATFVVPFGSNTGSQYFNFGSTYETDTAPSSADNSKAQTTTNSSVIDSFEVDTNQQVYVRATSSSNAGIGLRLIQWYYNL